jgi:hypothetical protein
MPRIGRGPAGIPAAPGRCSRAWRTPASLGAPRVADGSALRILQLSVHPALDPFAPHDPCVLPSGSNRACRWAASRRTSSLTRTRRAQLRQTRTARCGRPWSHNIVLRSRAAAPWVSLRLPQPWGRWPLTLCCPLLPHAPFIYSGWPAAEPRDCRPAVRRAAAVLLSQLGNCRRQQI